MTDKKTLYSVYISTGIILITVLLMRLNILPSILNSIFLGIYIGWIGATFFIRYLTLKEEQKSLMGKSKKMLDELKKSIPTNKE